MRWMAVIYVWLGPAMLTVYVAAGAGRESHLLNVC